MDSKELSDFEDFNKECDISVKIILDCFNLNEINASVATGAMFKLIALIYKNSNFSYSDYCKSLDLAKTGYRPMFEGNDV